MSPVSPRSARSLSRRTVLLGAGALAITGAAALAQDPVDSVPAAIGPGWTHVVGTGGSLLFYNAGTGAGLAGTLDNTGWHSVESYTAFTHGWDIIVATTAGSVLFVDPDTGLGASGLLQDGRWSQVQSYTDFSDRWTHGAATSDSVMLYATDTGQIATGTLIDGTWTSLHDASDSDHYSHLTGNDGSVFLYIDLNGYGATGTLGNGRWQWVAEYDDFSTSWSLQVGSGDSLLLVDPVSGAGAGGYLRDGTWEWITEYDDFSSIWTHVVAAGNDWVLFYDTNTGLAAWGTLIDGTWEYYGIASEPPEVIPTVPPPAAPPIDAPSIPQLDDYGRAVMEMTGVTGFSFAIARNGELVYAGAWGKADQNTAMTTSHRMRIASVSKPITSAAIMTLVQNGQLLLDTGVFGPDGVLGTTYGTQPYGSGIEDITVIHLLQHTAGGWSNAAPDPMYERTDLDADGLVSWVLDNVPLVNTPGTTFSYSNFGYCVLGRIIEHVSGQAYEDYVRTALLDPCGISSMQIAGDTLAERATNEVTYDDSLAPANYGKAYEIPVSRMDSHGGWIATPVDLLRFVVRVDDFPTPPDVLGPDAIDAMSNPSAANPIDGDPGYGMGWWVNGIGNWWHDGALAGTEAFLVRGNDGICWAALANSNGINFDRIGWEMIDRVRAWPDGVPL